MGNAEHQPLHYTAAEYFALEEQSEVRYEYFEGMIAVLEVGETKQQNILRQNIAFGL